MYFNIFSKYDVHPQIEALLKRINDENKKTKEVLDKIDRGEFKKEKRVDTVAYHRCVGTSIFLIILIIN